MSTLVDPDADKRYAPREDHELSDLNAMYNAESAKNSGSQKLADDKTIADMEKSFASPSSGETGSSRLPGGKAETGKKLNEKETDTGKDGLYSGSESDTRGKKRHSTRVKVIAAASGTAVGVSALGFGMISTPMITGGAAMVKAAKVLSSIHFTPNENFGDGRGTKTLLYAVSGLGAERARLGLAGNKGADIWEKKMVDTTGLKPVYSSTTRRFVGYQIVDADKVERKVGKLTTKTFGEGAEIKTASLASSGRQDILARNGKKTEKIPGDAKVIDMRNVSTKEARISIRSVGKNLGTNRGVSWLGSKLLIARGNVKLSAIPDSVRKSGDSVADYNKKLQEDRAKYVENGVKGTKVAATTEKDEKGNSDTDSEKAANDTNKVIDEAASKPGQTAIKNLTKTLGKGGLAVGVLCAAKGFGDNVEQYKYTQNILPMMRMGMDTIVAGNQVMSGQGFSVQALGAYFDQMYDEASGTSFFDAKSIRTNTGQDGSIGVNMPPEASLVDINSKPALFEAIDHIPLLGAVCGTLNAIGELPVLKQVGELASTIMSGITNTVLAPFSLSTDQLMEGALSVAAGKSVDAMAKGGERGALADTGAFLAANDNMMAMGGAPMTPAQAALVNQEARESLQRERQTESIAERYLDPYDYSSLVGAATTAIPMSANQAAVSLSTPIANVASSLSSFGRLFIPKSSAATLYDYGSPQYGFTLQEQEDERFEDPYDNAAVVENEIGLDKLNSKYGKCFGMTVTVSDSGGIQITTAKAGDEQLNQLKNAKIPECHDGSTELLRYRFYLADAVAINANNCNIANDDTACANLGVGKNPAASSSGTPSGQVGGPVAGSDRELAGKLADQAGKNIVFENQATVEQLKIYAGGGAITNACGRPFGISPYLSGALLSLTQSKYKLTIQNLGFQQDRSNGGTDCESTTRQHPLGNAVDLDGIEVIGGAKTSDGLNFAPGDADIASKFATDFFALLPADNGTLSRGGVGQKDCGLNPTFPPNSVALDGAHLFEDACNHLHIDVRNRTNLTEAAGKP